MPGFLRRRLRVGVGGLMLAVLGFGLWLGYRVHLAREQRVAVAAVEGAGGYVRYADEFAMGPVVVPRGNSLWKPGWGTLTPGKGPSAPAWLRRWLGDEYLREVVHVSLFVDIQKGSATAPGSDKPPLDGVLRALESQSGIRTLQLGGETVTDAGLASMAGMTELRELFIWWASGISDAGLAHLGRLPRLQLVDISLSSLTDEGVGHLADLPALEELSLQGRKFTDQGLAHLARAKSLRVLTLGGNESAFGDAGLAHLEGLPNLRRLHLQGGKFSDEAKQRLLKALPNLEFLP